MIRRIRALFRGKRSRTHYRCDGPVSIDPYRKQRIHIRD